MIIQPRRGAVRFLPVRAILQFELQNPARRVQEAVLLLPVPDGAAVSSFAFDGPATEPTARLLPRDEARALFENMLSGCNGAGFLSEDLDPRSGELWGNFPQTYSMVGLISSAMRLSRSWEEAF